MKTFQLCGSIFISSVNKIKLIAKVHQGSFRKMTTCYASNSQVQQHIWLSNIISRKCIFHFFYGHIITIKVYFCLQSLQIPLRPNIYLFHVHKVMLCTLWTFSTTKKQWKLGSSGRVKYCFDIDTLRRIDTIGYIYEKEIHFAGLDVFSESFRRESRKTFL